MMFLTAVTLMMCTLPGSVGANELPGGRHEGKLNVNSPVPGFADLHNHLFSEYGFGGAWIHGTVEGPIEKAMASCDFDDHAETVIPFISGLIGHIRGSTGDTGSHDDKHTGYPSFLGWPRWDTIAHQQNWEGYLKSAHENGMNLMIASAMSFEPLCRLMPAKNRKYPDCSDMVAVNRQLEALHRFEKNHDWFKIVTSPEEARAAIRAKKLAVVISIEVTNLFDQEDWKKGLDGVYAQGVRTLQLAHQLDNRFTGVAMHNPVFRMLMWWRDISENGSFPGYFTFWKYGFQTEIDPVDLVKKNKLGLTLEGKALLQEMMSRGMLIDLAHESEHAVKDIQAMTLTHGNYPVYMSHGHFRNAMEDGKFSQWEKSSGDWVLDYIKDSGGMFGLRTGPEKTKTYPQSKVPNDCQGTTKSFAQTYQYGMSRGVSLAFGSDLNGFIQQLRPRFGNADETCGAQDNAVEKIVEQNAQKQALNKRFDSSGFGDISQLPDVLTELKHFGIDTNGLDHSAEAFIQMWEKAERMKGAGSP
jgi:microsomal dipeptidase-like Zn-dependent dipeptidase